jgi:hypothetical protein
MRQDLDSFAKEFEREAAARGFVLFHSYRRGLDDGVTTYWQVETHPDIKGFLDAAEGLGVRVLAYSCHRFGASIIDDTLERLEECDLPFEDRRDYENQLKRLRAYEGFVSDMEISFDYQHRTYLYDLETEWHREFMELLDEIHEMAFPSDAEDEDEGPVGGYFSRN